MLTWLSTTQHKINAAIIVALIFAASYFLYRQYSREKNDKAVAAAALRAVKATVADSVTQRLLKPKVDTLEAQIKALQSKQQQQEVSNLLMKQRNENLHKQLDSVNAVLACAPTFNAMAQAPKPGLNSAQYRLISAGEPAPYAGVILSIPTYRAEGEKLKLQGEIMDAQDRLIAGLRTQLVTTRSESEKRATEVQTQQDMLKSCEDSKREVSASSLITQRAYADSKPKFFEKPLFWGLVGFGLGTFTGIKIAVAVSK